jgi:MATE family multidrug resistance protein
MDALKGWKEFLALGFPGAFQMCAEWWGFEITALLAGLLGTVELAR